MIIAIEIILLGGLSIIGCVFVIWCFFKFKKLRTDQLRIVINIIIFDLIQQSLLVSSAIGYFAINEEMQFTEFKSLCYGESALLQYSVIASTTWTSLIANNLYNAVKYGKSHYRYILYSIIGYGFPLFMSVIPFAFSAYGISNVFPNSMCSFNFEKIDIRFYILFFQDIPIWATFFYNAIIFGLVIKELYHNLGIECFQQNRQLFLLFLYPFLVGICWGMPATINQFKVDAKIWPIIAFGFGSLIGLLDSYLYCYLSLVRKVQFKNFRLVLREDQIELSKIDV